MSHKIASFALLITLAAFQLGHSQTTRVLSGRRALAQQNRANDPQSGLAEQIADIELQINRIKAEQKSFNKELQAIEKVAKQEKATQTLAEVQKLLQTKNTQYATQIERLQVRLRRLQTTVSEMTKRNQAENRIDTVAPAFTAKTLKGDIIDSTQFKGKVLVMEWFNPECPYTQYAYQRGKIKDLQALYANRDDVVWIKISSTQQKKVTSLPEFVNKEQITVPVIDDSADNKLATLYYAKSTPQIIIVSKDGKIAYSGRFDNSLPRPQDGNIIGYVAQALDELTHDKPVSRPFTAPSGTPINPK